MDQSLRETSGNAVEKRNAILAFMFCWKGRTCAVEPPNDEVVPCSEVVPYSVFGGGKSYFWEVMSFFGASL